MVRVQDPGRRAALLDAGKRVFATRGVSKTTVDEITQSAGVAKGTFYLYFNSKIELIEALRSDFSEKISFSLQENMARRTNDGWENEAQSLIHSAVNSYFRMAPSYQAVLNCPTFESNNKSWESNITSIIAEFLREAIKQNACNVTDPEVAALFLFHGISGVCHHALRDDSWNEERTKAAIESFVEPLFATTRH